MTFQPVVPMAGYSGWLFLERTMESQRAVQDADVTQKRDVDYFAENISKIRTAEDLVGDRQLLKVALGAFGLDDDIDSKFLIRKVLEEGSTESGALANRLGDSRYVELSKAFGFGDGGARTSIAGFSDTVIAAYQERQFESAVGDQDEDIGIALAVRRELSDIVSGDLSDDGKWYSILGSEDLRQAFQTAFGLPDSFSQLDLDKQVDVLGDKVSRITGSEGISAFSDEDKVDELIRRFLLMSEVSAMQSSMSSSGVALSLLSGLS